MPITIKDRAGLQTQALFEIEQNWRRGFVPSQAKRVWLAREVADAIFHESYEHVGAERGGVARERLAEAVANRVYARNSDPVTVAVYAQENGDGEAAAVGSVFLVIILGAVLSWLIGRLLDWYFPQSAPLAANNFLGAQSMFSFLDGYKTYIVAGVAIAYAVSAAAMGKISPNEAFELVMVALGFGTLRGGSKTDAKTVIKELK